MGGGRLVQAVAQLVEDRPAGSAWSDEALPDSVEVGRDGQFSRGHKVELCLTPTYASWANPIEAQFGPLRTFVMGASNHPNHPVLARRLQAYLRWRNANARHPDVLTAQRRERARIRSERQLRWGRPKAA